MKKAGYSIIIGIMAILLSSGALCGQSTKQSYDQQKKQEEAEKKLQKLSEEEQQKVKQAEKTAEEARKKIISEEELQKKIAEIQADSEGRRRDFERQFREFDDIIIDANDFTRKLPFVIMSDADMFSIVAPSTRDYYVYGSHGYGDKPGSSWNYSRQVMEASFTNEFSMSAGDESNVNLSVSGDCAEGSIIIVIKMPDGRELSKVMLDENGSLNWRKSFKAGEDNGWGNGKWVFIVKAENATGNFRISMSSN